MSIATSADAPPSAITFDHSTDPTELARARRDRVRFVDVPERRFFAIDGEDRPGGPVYAGAIGTLYPVAYTLHFMLRSRGLKRPIGMLEGLYWIPAERLLADQPTDGFAGTDPMSWRLMLSVPDEAGEPEIERAIVEAARRRPLPLASVLKVIRFAEGPSAQILHVGSYASETESLRRLHGAIVDAGYVARGPHHEIYLNDPRQVGEEKTKTVLRQPMALNGNGQ